jgi:tRNA uridine 5-carbamoylmethylation protein Kti12
MLMSLIYSVPNHVWQDIFEREWKSSRRMWDRKLFVVGDNLRLVTTKDDIEDKLDWVKQVIERTNTSLDEYNREEEARGQQIEEEMRNRASEEEKTSIDVIRDNLRRRFGAL